MKALFATCIMVLSSAFIWPAYGMSVIDYTLDQSTLRGRIVAVDGNPLCVGDEVCFLYSPGLQTSVAFNPRKLPRGDREKLLHCAIFTNECDATITFKSGEAFIAQVQSIGWN